MEKDIVDGKIGAVGAYDLEFKEGALQFKIQAAHSGASVELVIKADAAGVLDALAAAIPGQVDNAIFGVMKAALVGQ